MAVFRIERTRDYTVMSNHHLRNANLSLKAKGLLSMMLSLPEDWNYTTRGLAKICKEGVDAIGTALRELEAAGYIVRHKLRDRQGRISDTEYVIYEQPQPKNPDTPQPDMASPDTENPDMSRQERPAMTKPRTKTLEELTAEIEDGKKKIRQFENREKMLRQKLSKEERRTRSHRLIVRGAVFESIVPEAKGMTDEEAAALLRIALTSQPAREYLKKRAEGGKSK